MIKEFTLKEFINLCNECNETVSENPKDDALALATWIEEIKNNPNYIFKDINDQEFYNSLIRRGYTFDSKEYKFLCDESIVAKVEPFIPFDNRGILSQKWHVLISLLAYLDTASFDKNVNMPDKYKFDKIEKIIIDYDDEWPLKINGKFNGKDKVKKYKSKLMIDWIKLFI